MYIHVGPRSSGACARSGLGDPAPPRRPLKDADVPVSSTSAATTGIARRVRDAIVRMSRTSDPTLQNTAQRVVDGDVTLRFVGDLKPVANPEAVLLASGVPAAEIATVLQNNALVEIPGSDPALVPKKGTVRAFQRNGVIYIPTGSSEPNLSTDIIHETNHAMNPIRANAAVDRGGFLWESFAAEARASYVADYRGETGVSSTADIHFGWRNLSSTRASRRRDPEVDQLAGVERGGRGARAVVDAGWQSGQPQVRRAAAALLAIRPRAVGTIPSLVDLDEVSAAGERLGLRGATVEAQTLAGGNELGLRIGEAIGAQPRQAGHRRALRRCASGPADESRGGPRARA